MRSGFHVMTGSFIRPVKISQPFSVTSTVCSNCALRFPSTVTAVQLSPHVQSLGRSHIDHWLHCKDVTHLHGTLGFVFMIVRHIGGSVKQRPDSVTTVCPYDAAFVFAGDFVDSCSKITVESSRLDHIQCCRQALKGRLNQLSTFRVNVPYAKGFIEISMIPTGIEC